MSRQLVAGDDRLPANEIPMLALGRFERGSAPHMRADNIGAMSPRWLQTTVHGWVAANTLSRLAAEAGWRSHRSGVHLDGQPDLVDKGWRLSTHRRGDADTSLAGPNSRSSLAIRRPWVTPVASSGRSSSGPGQEPRSPPSRAAPQRPLR